MPWATHILPCSVTLQVISRVTKHALDDYFIGKEVNIAELAPEKVDELASKMKERVREIL